MYMYLLAIVNCRCAT